MIFMKFSAEWCGPCKMIAPIVQDISAETGIPVVHIDIDHQPGVAEEFGVQGVPTLILFDDESNEVDRSVGAKPKAALMQHFFPES